MKPRTKHDLFSLGDLRLFRNTAVLAALVLLGGLIIVVFWAFAAVLSIFYNLIFPLAIAGILALILFPLMKFVERRLHCSRVVAIGIIFIALALFFVTMLLVIGPTVVQQATDLIETAPELFWELRHRLAYYFPALSEMLTARMEENGFQLMEFDEIGSYVTRYMGLLAGLSFVPLYLFFALLSGERLRSHGMELLTIFRARTRQRILYFVDIFLGYVTAFFRGQMMIAMIMGVMYAIGFSIIGLQLAIPIGLILGFLNIVPFLGTVVGILIVLPMSMFQEGGGAFLLVTALGVFALVQLVESWLLTPKIMAHHSGLPPALVVISVFFWGIALGGIVGMILAVPLTAFFVATWRPIKASLKRGLHPEEDLAEGAGNDIAD